MHLIKVKESEIIRKRAMQELIISTSILKRFFYNNKNLQLNVIENEEKIENVNAKDARSKHCFRLTRGFVLHKEARSKLRYKEHKMYIFQPRESFSGKIPELQSQQEKEELKTNRFYRSSSPAIHTRRTRVRRLLL